MTDPILTVLKAADPSKLSAKALDAAIADERSRRERWQAEQEKASLEGRRAKLKPPPVRRALPAHSTKESDDESNS